MEVFLTKDKGSFTPIYGNDYDKVTKIPEGSEVKAVITRPRNIEHHRKFFALLRLVAENLPESLAMYTNIDLLLDEIKFQLGHYELRLNIDGNPYYTVKSINFSKMGQDEFKEFYDKSIDVVLKHFLTGNTKEELIKEVIDYS